MELLFTIKNYGIMGKKNYGTILRTMELRFKKKTNIVDHRKLRDFDL